MQPTGYWLKHLDRLVNESFDRALASEEIARRHWQVINVLDRAPQDEQGIHAALSPFLTEGAITVDEVVDDLLRLGWIVRTEGRYTLTASGQAAFARLGERVQALRGRLMDGLAPSDYSNTVRVLGHMADNLER